MSGIILLSSKGKAPGLLRLRLRLATASLLAMTDEKTFYEAVNIGLRNEFYEAAEGRPDLQGAHSIKTDPKNRKRISW